LTILFASLPKGETPMARKKQETNPVDCLLDELLTEYQTPEEILGESGLLKQLTKR
jgi:hypothetical protein